MYEVNWFMRINFLLTLTAEAPANPPFAKRSERVGAWSEITPDATPDTLSVEDDLLSVSIGHAIPLSGHLAAVDSNSSDQLIYQLVAPPKHGTLLVYGAPASLFTQAQIDDGSVQDVASGDGAGSDSFTFTVFDSVAH